MRAEAILCAVTADQAHQGPDPLGEAREATNEALDAARDRADAAREAAGERLDATRDAAGRQLRDARDSAAAAAVGVAQKLPKPRLRGVSHQWAFFASLLTGAALIVAAQGGREVLAVSIYAFSLSALLGTSALYHRVTWDDGRAPLDAPPGPHDDLRADRRHLHARSRCW